MGKLKKRIHDDTNGPDYVLVGDYYHKENSDIRKVYQSGVSDSILET